MVTDVEGVGVIAVAGATSEIASAIGNHVFFILRGPK